MDSPIDSPINSLLAPSGDDLLALALATVEALPAPLRAHARQVALRVEEFASDALLDEMRIDDPFNLTGLYDGIPLPEKSSFDQPTRPDTIWLYRRAILDEWVARGNVTLAELVAHVTIHEFAHHFGWSDEDIAAVDRWWE